MRTRDQRSREIVEIIGDIVSETASGCTLLVTDYKGNVNEIECPTINYSFGNAQYIKDRLDELCTTPTGNEMKFPLIALFCPLVEKRDSPDYYSASKVNILIACSSVQQWSNEQRLETSFENILRPIYRSFLAALLEDGRLDFGYDEQIPHEYSENYSYGRYGAHTSTGDALSEPIDAINISNLEITVKNINCRQQ